jgi:hypothetical protein
MMSGKQVVETITATSEKLSDANVVKLLSYPLLLLAAKGPARVAEQDAILTTVGLESYDWSN